jgi:hypothetical protein
MPQRIIQQRHDNEEKDKLEGIEKHKLEQRNRNKDERRTHI